MFPILYYCVYYYCIVFIRLSYTVVKFGIHCFFRKLIINNNNYTYIKPKSKISQHFYFITKMQLMKKIIPRLLQYFMNLIFTLNIQKKQAYVYAKTFFGFLIKIYRLILLNNKVSLLSSYISSPILL